MKINSDLIKANKTRSLLTYEAIYFEDPIEPGGSTTLTFPANTVWIEPLIASYGNDAGSGGSFIAPGTGFCYIVNSDYPIDDTSNKQIGEWISVQWNGKLTHSAYRSAGRNLKGVRIWYLNM